MPKNYKSGENELPFIQRLNKKQGRKVHGVNNKDNY